MRFPDSFLDEIRERLPISEVVGSRVTWDKRKTNPARGDYWACCPFHGEKTPSFHCENRKGRYHCFGCGASGDHFRFLAELDGLSFPEAVERLADQAGLPVPVMDRRQREREEQRASLFDVMEMAAQFLREALQGPEGAAARAYLRDRGVLPKTQIEFGIGYAPESRNALKNHLASQGVTKEQMEACGLVVSGPDIPVSYDRFRDRIMFPIPNSRGRVIAFGGRALRNDVPAKYLNSPETDLFHKSNVLFNYLRARPVAREKSQLVVAEGYMDVIALHQAGLANAVAPMGTALTDQQLQLLWRLSPVPTLCFDGDDAGVRAANRAADLVLCQLRAGCSAHFAILPAGMDPDDVLRAEGPDAMRSIVEQAIPLADFVWTRETSSGMFDTPEKRAALETRLRQLAAGIGEESVRRHYGQEFADRLEALFGARRDPAQTRRSTFRRPDRSGGRGARVRAGRRVQASSSLLNSALVRNAVHSITMREAALLAGIVHHPSILQRLFEEFAAMPLSSAEARKLHSVILDAAAQMAESKVDIESSQLVDAITGAGLGDLLDRSNEKLRTNGVWQALPGAGFEDALDGWRQSYSLHLRVHALRSELKTAETTLADEENEANFQRLVQIHEELAREEGIEALIDGFGVSSGRPLRRF